jgi:hypothetical protein
MTSGNGLTVSYSSYNKPTSITRGTSTIGFSHDPEHQRFQQTAPGGTTLYIAGSGILAERFAGVGSSSTVRFEGALRNGGARRWTGQLTSYKCRTDHELTTP